MPGVTFSMKLNAQADDALPLSAAVPRVLVIGYGSRLRGDDGVGQLVAEEAGKRFGERVRAVAVHQLTPELSALCAKMPCVIFVDACVSGVERVACVRLTPRLDPTLMNHACDPEGILALARNVYGAAPEGWLIAIPAQAFDWGEALSPVAAAGRADALEVIGRLLEAR
jgi:hydrogenase maturation protease